MPSRPKPTKTSPSYRVSCQSAATGSRGLLPPVVSAPSFTIRKRASRLIPLEDYLRGSVMTAETAELIRNATNARLNISRVRRHRIRQDHAGKRGNRRDGPHIPEHRLVILEDAAETQCAAENAVSLHTTNTVDMARRLKSTMRLRPDRIIVGGVRDGAAEPSSKHRTRGIPVTSRRSTPIAPTRLCGISNNSLPRQVSSQCTRSSGRRATL